MENITLITAVSGLVFGFLGAVLGLVNTWRAINHDRIRIKVSPQWCVFSDGEHALSIEVINLGHVPVTINQVAFKMRDPKVTFSFLPIQAGDSIPKRLEPRTSLTAIARPGTENNPAMREVVSAFAKTACGEVFTGTSPALKGAVNKARSAGT